MSVRPKVEHFLSLNMPTHAEALIHHSAHLLPIYEFYTLLARAQFMRGNIEKARSYAKRSTRLAPTDAEAWRVRALPEISTRNLVNAQRFLRSALLLDPVNVNAYATATTHSRSGARMHEAERYSRQAQLISPTANDALRSRAALLFDTGKLEDADRVNRWAIITAPNVGRPYFLLSLLSSRLKRPAGSAAKRALLIQPTDDGPRMALVEQYVKARNISGLSVEVRRAILTNPHTPVGYLSLVTSPIWTNLNIRPLQQLRKLTPLGLDAQLCGRQMAAQLAGANKQDETLNVLQYLLTSDRESLDAKIHLGAAYLNFGRYREAERIAKIIVNLEKANPKGWLLYADVLARQGLYEAAERIIKGGLAYTNKDYSLWAMYGTHLREQERYVKSLKTFQRALYEAPTRPQAYENLANAYDLIGKEERVTKIYARGLHFRGKSARGMAALANIALQSGDEGQALARARDACDLDPLEDKAVEAYVKASIACEAFDDALQAAKRHYERFPGKISALSQYATTLAQSGEIDAAMRLIERKLPYHPRSIQLIRAYWSICSWSGDLSRALKFHIRAVRLHSEKSNSRTGLSMHLLSLGHWADGFDAYESGFEQIKRGRGRKRKFKQPRWQGEDLTGKSIVIHTEQGVGDEIMFATVVPDLIKWASKVYLEGTKRMTYLFNRSFPDAKVIPMKLGGEHETDESIDYYVPVGSLGRYLRRSTSLFGRSRPYLQPDPDLSQELRQKYKSRHGDNLIVGIGWRGGSAAVRRKRRSFQATDLLPILKYPGVTFVCVQYGDVEEEVAAVNRDLDKDVIFDPTVDPLKDLVASASQIAACDLIISATNAGVHTAGGLGVPCWTLVPFESDWRWTWGRDDVVWYPGMRIFRQEALDENWGHVITRVKHEFESLLGGDHSRLRSPPARDLDW